jgi:hypothetical protein
MSAAKKPADATPTPEDRGEDNPDGKGEENLDTGPQHVHSHGPIETKRTFRRKTG